MSASRLFRTLTPLAFFAALGACGPVSEPEPRVPAGLTLSGTLPSDTVDASVPEPLTITVGDAAGKPLADVRVLLEASYARHADEPARVAATFTNRSCETCARVTEVRTDARGEAKVWVRYGIVARPVYVIAATFALGGQLRGRDSIAVVVEPGSPDSVEFSPLDSTVYPGRTYALTARTVDRYGNTSPVLPLLESTNPAVLAIEGQTVRAVAPGRVWVIGTVGKGRDTAAVSVVPFGRLVAYERSRSSGDRPVFRMFELDGSDYSSVGGWEPPYNNRSQYRIPGTGALVFHAGDRSSNLNPLGLFVMELDGTLRTLMAPGQGLEQAMLPQPTRDGAWIYFTARLGYEDQEIWRVRPDGSELGRVGLRSVLSPLYSTPSPSPDGRTLAVAEKRYSRPGEGVLLLDVASGDTTRLAMSARRVRWSPVGAEVAFFGMSGLEVVGVSGKRVLGPISLTFPAGWDETDGQLDWSPDGEWLVACVTGRHLGWRSVTLIRRATGELVPLQHTARSNLCGAAWWD